MQIVLRIFVALLALGGAAGSAFLALGFNTVLTEADEIVRARMNLSIAEASKLSTDDMATKVKSPRAFDVVKGALDDFNRCAKVMWFFYAGAALGFLGMLYAVSGKGKSAAALLLVSIVGPVLLLYNVKP